jgi:hypothetical protein
MRIGVDQARTIDAICKIVTAIALVGAGGWTVTSYLLHRSDELRIAGIQARSPFEQKRLELYVEAVSSAATIATSKDANEVGKAKDRFWTLYWGPLALVEDNTVENSMVKLGGCISDQKKCEQPIEQLALELAHNCRNSLAESWDVQLSKSDVTKLLLERLGK